MSETHGTYNETQEHQGANGVAPPGDSRTKRRIASARIDGAVARLDFAPEFGGGTVTIDTSRIPQETREMLAAYGASLLVQTAYNTKGVTDPQAAAEKIAAKLLAGDWRPGTPRGSTEPDVLLAALAKHLDRDLGYVEDTYIPNYAKTHGVEVGPAKRRLRSHPAIAAHIATIMADRAKRAAQQAKKLGGESLDLP